MFAVTDNATLATVAEPSYNDWTVVQDFLIERCQEQHLYFSFYYALGLPFFSENRT